MNNRPHGKLLDRPKRIVMVVTGFPTPANPASGIFNLRAAKALQAFVDITVVHVRTWRPGRPLRRESKVEGVPVITLAVPQTPWRGRVSMSISGRLGWSAINAELASCDVIHSVGLNIAGVLCSRWSIKSGIAHVAQVIGSDINADARRSNWLWPRGVQAIACNSRALEREIRSRFPNISSVRTLYRGVDLQRFNSRGPLEGPLAEARPVRFLYLGGFPKTADGNDLKGGQTLLSVWAAVEREMHTRGATLLIVAGGGEQTVRRWRARLQHPEAVHVLRRISPELVPAYLRATDVLLVPSRQEGLPNVAMEASACGVAVFGSNVGGLPEVIEHGVSGLLLPAADVASWKHALVSYADQPSRLKQMGAAARARMERMFDSRHYAEDMFKLYCVATAEQRVRAGVGADVPAENTRETEWPSKPLSIR